MNKKATLILFFSLLAISPLAFAANGTIDSTNKYAWGETTGWLNFGTTGGDVRISDATLVGYVWSENYGWINLNPSNGGVKNNGFGHLSGFAWGEQIGAIGFEGVTILSNGVFTGTASGTVAGRINFDCDHCKVVTDWRAPTASSEGVAAGGGGGGGGGGAGVASGQGWAVTINGGAGRAENPNVTLAFTVSPATTAMILSNFSDFRDAHVESFAGSRSWNICSGAANCPYGSYTVYARFFDSENAASPIVSASILYEQEQGIAGAIKRTLEQLIPPFLRPGTGAPSVAALPPRVAPPPLRSAWNLIPKEPVREFVFAPLPKELTRLAEKFPQLAKTLKDVGIARQSDLSKLLPVTLSLPGLTERVGVSRTQVLPGGEIVSEGGIPLSELAPDLKKSVPTEIVFVRSKDGKVDFEINLGLSESGVLEKRIQAVTGSELELAIKPIGAVHGITGHVLLRNRDRSDSVGVRSNPFTLRQALASLVFQTPVFAEEVPREKVEVERRLALSEFEYADPDNDGIYTATITMPNVYGEYDIVTIISYKDPELGTRQIMLTAVVDPEGYVYEKQGGKEARIAQATVSLYSLNPATNKYELWPAEEYSQHNPQVTDMSGSYAFLVPPGNYYLAAKAPGYAKYTGQQFSVSAGKEVHLAIELRPQGILPGVDWETAVIVLVILLLVLNFLMDRRRNRLPPPEPPRFYPPASQEKPPEIYPNADGTRRPM
ncbi:MAG: carboxypeptidase regulatory-like domain-containing protein [Candidatus Liptonbacteria bacterium]|nr:carboxypeptidase regulatory-like domain-containing protein [Candidatus Liptonbacteria bacterium]